MSLLATLPELRGGRALDVATGGGTLAFELADRFDAVDAIDLPEVIARVAPAAHPVIRWTGMDAEALAFPEASFDAVAIAWSLHHLRDPRRVLAEMRRVLAPGGRLVVIEPFQAWTGTFRDHHLRAHVLGAHLDRAQGRWHDEVYTRERVERLVGALGLRELTVTAVMAPDEGDPSAEAIAPWVALMQRTADAPDVLPLVRQAARECADVLKRDGIGCSPYLVVSGQKD